MPEAVAHPPEMGVLFEKMVYHADFLPKEQKEPAEAGS